MRSLKLTSTKEHTDEELIALVTTKPALFKLIVDRYHPEFLRKARHMLGSADDAEDAVQDVFIKIYTNAESFEVRNGASFKSWAYTILIHTCYSYSKKSRRQRSLVNNLDSDELDATSPALVDERKLDLDHFISVVAKIPALLGRMLVLGVIEGKSQEEIAASEGISPGTVRTRLHRAKKAFKKALS